jgi:hypothetical protein
VSAPRTSELGEDHGDAAARGAPGVPRILRGEVIAALGAALALPLLAWLLLEFDPRSLASRFDPLDRGHQVSVVSLLTLACAGAAVGWLLLLLGPARSRSAASRWHLATAGLASTASGVWAVGALLALHGTSWSFFADRGDAGRYIEWAADLSARPSEYPPGGLWLLRGMAIVLDMPEAMALKPTTILVMALTGPLSYLAWRMVSAPTFALYAGVVAAVPYWQSYLPMRRIVLFLIVPVMLAAAQLLLEERPTGGRREVARAAGLGLAFGALTLLYSGWTYFLALTLLPLGVLGVIRLVRDDPRARLRRLGVLVAFGGPTLLVLA